MMDAAIAVNERASVSPRARAHPKVGLGRRRRRWSLDLPISLYGVGAAILLREAYPAHSLNFTIYNAAVVVLLHSEVSPSEARLRRRLVGRRGGLEGLACLEVAGA